MSPSPAMALAPPAGRGLGEGWSRARPTTWGEGAERLT